MHRTFVATSAAVAAIALSTLALDGVAAATTGSSLILGRANSASATTVIQSGAAPVLSLRSSSGTAAPLAVNGSGRVANLNADRIDSLDSSQLQRRIAATCPAGQALVGVDPVGRPLCRGLEPTATVVSVHDLGPFDDERTFTSPDLPAGRFLVTFTAELTPTLRGTVASPKQASCTVGAGGNAVLSATAFDNGTATGAAVRSSDVVVLDGGPLTISCGFERGTWAFSGGSAPRVLLMPLPSVSLLSAS